MTSSNSPWQRYVRANFCNRGWLCWHNCMCIYAPCSGCCYIHCSVSNINSLAPKSCRSYAFPVKLVYWSPNCVHLKHVISKFVTHVRYVVWNYLSTPINFNGCTVEVWEWISNFIPHIVDIIIYPCMHLFHFTLSDRDSVSLCIPPIRYICLACRMDSRWSDQQGVTLSHQCAQAVVCYRQV